MYSKRLFCDGLVPEPITLATSQLKCTFDGTVAIGSAYTEPAAGAGTSRNFIKDLTGTDSNGTVYPTSFAAFFGASTKMRIQSIPSESVSGANDAAKEVTLNTLFNHEIRTLSAPINGKTKYLHNEISSRTIAVGSSPAPQTDPVILRDSAITADIKRMCVRHVLRLPSNLDTLLEYPSPANANWVILQDFKTGNYGAANGVGDYRFKLQIYRGVDGLYWGLRGDNGANGVGTIPSSDADPTTYWSIDNTTVPVFLDEWLEFYTFIKRPETYWTRETPGDTNTPYVRDLITGRTVVVMYRISTGQWYLIGDQVGGEQMGVENCIWTRLFFLTYCNANTPVYIDTLELEFFDNLPFTLESKGLA